MATVSILKSNTGKCPLWDVDVSVYGWYRETTSGIWEFLRAECPIIENAKLPRDKQEQKYELMFCKDHSACPLYTRFQPKTTKDI